MTTVELYRAGDGTLCGFCAQGHAGAQKKRGYDLVCAGVSALTQTAVNALETVARIKPFAQVSDGLLRCSLPDERTQEQTHTADIVLRTMAQGLLDIQTIYPAFVRVVYKEWR